MQRNDTQCERVCFTLETLDGAIVDSARDELDLYVSGEDIRKEFPKEPLYLLKHTLQ